MRKHKKLVSFVISVLLMLSLLPIWKQTISATIVGALQVEDGVSGTDFYYDSSSQVLTILTSQPLTISNVNPDIANMTEIIVANNVAANLTFAGVYIDLSAQPFGGALDLRSAADTKVTFATGTNNILRSGEYKAGIATSYTNSVEINGNGSLEAKGGDNAAGIGGSGNAQSGFITINGGMIHAIGGFGGAGIGAGPGTNGDLQEVQINGGVVTAIGGTYAPGIGNGYDVSAGTPGQVNIRGGVVTAIGGSKGAGIGGSVNAEGCNTTITSGVVVATGTDGGAGIGGGFGINGDGRTTIISGGTVTATGSEAAAGIGAGSGGSNSGSFSTNVGEQKGNAFIITSSSPNTADQANWSGILFIGSQGEIYNSPLTLAENATIVAGLTLTLQDGETLIIPDGITLVNDGTIINNNGGRIIHSGTITNNGTVVASVPTLNDLSFHIPSLTYNGYAQGITLGENELLGTVSVFYNNSSLTPTNAGTYSVTADVTGDIYNFTSATSLSLGDLIIQKASQNPPSVPNLASVSANQITIHPPTGSNGTLQYAISTTDTPPSNWQSEKTFTGLHPNTNYYIFAQLAGDMNHLESEVSQGLEVKTNLLEYDILSGRDETWILGSKKNHTIEIDGPYVEFLSVSIDGKIISDANYLTKQGSTIVILKENYLETLAKGTHEIYFNFENGYAKTTLSIAQNKKDASGDDMNKVVNTSPLPNTGDTSLNIGFLILLMAASMLVAKRVHKREHKRS